MLIPCRYRQIATLGSNLRLKANIVIRTTSEEQKDENDNDSLSCDDSISSEEIEPEDKLQMIGTHSTKSAKIVNQDIILEHDQPQNLQSKLLKLSFDNDSNDQKAT